MPIPLEKFEKAKKPLEDRILEFLQRNRTQAFSIIELIVACEEVSYHDQYGALYEYLRFGKEYESALRNLLENNIIKIGRLGGETYYGIA